MGCGCAKKKINGQQVMGASAARKAVYQVIKDGQVLSEHGTPAEARKSAAEAGGKLRITSKAATSAVS